MPVECSPNTTSDGSHVCVLILFHPARGILYHMSPIQLDPNPADRFQATTLEAAQANARFAFDAEVAKFNASKMTDYDTQWKAYVAARDARPDATNLIEPLPAFAEAVYGTSGEWPYIATSGRRVVTPHVYVPPQNKQSSGGFSAGSLFDQGALSVAVTFNVPIAGRVKYGGMEFMRIA